MAAKNDNVSMIEVPVVRNQNGVDVGAIVANAERIAKEFATQDAAATKAVVATTNRILNDPKYKEATSFTAGVIAKMVLGYLQEIPSDKLCADTEERVKAFLKGQPDKFLNIERGRNAGFHIISRYKAEDLERLQKSAKTTEAQ